METRWIDIPLTDNQSCAGYLALPPTGRGPGIVLIQEIFGVNHHIRAVAEQYAMDGYVVLAPDVFWRMEPRVDLNYDDADMQKARGFLQQMDIEQATQDVAQAVTHLRALPEIEGGVGVLGYCMGGHLAYRVAATGASDAAVAYYGGGIQNNLHLAQQVEKPILFHFGELDHVIPQDAVAQIKTAFAEHRSARCFDYSGANHGFNCWARPSYNQRAAAMAHGRTLEFLAGCL